MADVIVAHEAPYEARPKTGREPAWRVWGRSATEPFCDGTRESL